MLAILLDQRENVADYLADVGLAAGIFCAISLLVGYVVPRPLGVRDDQAIACSMEIGVHNATLAIFVAVEVLDSTEISVPAAVYSLFMFVFATLWGCSSPGSCTQAPSDLWSQLSERPAAVADRVLVGHRQLGGGRARVLVGDEHHVVAEATGAAQSRG